MASSFWLVLLILSVLFLPEASSPGIRGPGRYSGVVVFDRWDGCILFSSVYLMYVSENAKEGLRAYAGHAMEIDALEVSQPINPGDGLIRKYKVIGPAQYKLGSEALDGLRLSASLGSAEGSSPSVTLKILNQGREPLRIDSSQFGLALIAKKQGQLLDAADGPSTAVITRAGVLNGRWKSERNENGVMHSYSYTLDPNSPLPEFFDLEPGQAKVTTIAFHVSPGEYDFIFGYGGGVHEAKSVASNRAPIDVNDRR